MKIHTLMKIITKNINLNMSKKLKIENAKQ